MWAIILTITIPVIAAIVAIILINYDFGYFDCISIPFGVLIGFLCFMLMGCFVLLPGEMCVADNIDNCIIVETTTQELSAIKDNSNINGSGYYRHCYIDEELYYNYLYYTDKGIAQGKVPAENTYIVFKDVETAILTTNKTEVKKGFYKGWEGPTEYILTLPLDAEVVEDEYVIDLE